MTNMKKYSLLLLAPYMFLLADCIGIKSYKNYKRVIQTGIPAVVVVSDLEDTRVTINNNPCIRLTVTVYTKDLEPYETQITDTFSIIELPRRGSIYYAKIDSTNRSNVVLLRRSDAAPYMDEFRYIMENKLAGHNATLPGSRLIDTRIGKNGVTQPITEQDTLHWQKGTARILSVQDTGKSSDFEPVIILVLEVLAPGMDA
ncbi:MAG: hypothetical protein JSV88_31370, partial [Candidatus Aminicenantes bacterium]